MITQQHKPSSTLLTQFLPGPDRKRTPSPYHFRIRFRNSNLHEVGCLATWDVLGGRENYQISLERTENSELRWHCCCPDAVYREDHEHHHRCKHVQGLLEAFETITLPVFPTQTAA